MCIVERLFSSSLVAIVSLKAPRKLKVCHFKKGTEICNYSYSNTILAVKLNRQVSDAPLRSRLLCARSQVCRTAVAVPALPGWLPAPPGQSGWSSASDSVRRPSAPSPAHLTHHPASAQLSQFCSDHSNPDESPCSPPPALLTLPAGVSVQQVCTPSSR